MKGPPCLGGARRSAELSQRNDRGGEGEREIKGEAREKRNPVMLTLSGCQASEGGRY